MGNAGNVLFLHFQFFSAKLLISFLPSHPILFCQAIYFCQGGAKAPPAPPPRTPMITNTYDTDTTECAGGDQGGYMRGGQWSRSPPCSSGARLLSSPRHPALGGSNPEVRRVQDTSTTALSKRLLERDGVHYYPGPEAPAQSSSVTFSDNGDTITSHRSPY